MGDKLQNKGIEKLRMMNIELDEDNKLIQEVNQELHRQGEVLASTDEDLNDIKSTLKRAQQYITYFSHEYYKDKFIRIMIIIICLVVIVIVASSIMRKKNAVKEAEAQ